MSAVLIGYRGSGKSTIGRKLADRLWWGFADLDERVVEKAGGLSIKEIFERDGEGRFRDLETDALKEVLLEKEKVLALGGGAIVREANRDLIKASGLKVIYLRCDAAVLLQRIQADVKTAQTRPNLTGLGGGIEEVRAMLAQREPWYRQVATGELDVTNLTIDEAVVHLARQL